MAQAKHRKMQVRLVDTEFNGIEFAGLDGAIVEVVGQEFNRYGCGEVVVDVLFRGRQIEVADYELVEPDMMHH